MKRILAALSLALALGFMPAIADAQATMGYNGTGSITRPNNTTSYGSGAVTKLFAANTAGNAVPMPISILGTTPGSNLIVGARLRTTGTGASAAAYKVSLYALSSITTTGLADGSTYVGPYTADLPVYIGSLTCAAMTPTNDGTATYYSECSASNQVIGPLRFSGAFGSTATLYAMVEVTTGYTPIANEVLSVDLATTY